MIKDIYKSVEKTFFAILIFDKQFKLNYINEIGAKNLSYNISEIKGVNLKYFFKENKIEIIQKNKLGILIKAFVKNKGMKYFKVIIEKNKDDKIIYLLDVSFEQKKMNILFDIFELRDYLFNYIDDYIFIYELNNKLEINRLLEVNLKVKKELYYTQNELFDKKINELFIIKAKDLYSKNKTKSKLVRRNGSYITVELTKLKIENKNLFIIIAKDIEIEEKANNILEKNLQNRDKLIDEIVETVSKIVEQKDPYTTGHQKNVAKIAVKIAQKLELDDDIVKAIEIAGKLHDVGKISIPTDLLNKPGKLINEEFSLIKTHVDSGYDILKNIDFPWDIAEYVLEHHERLDGSGYPRGLKDNEIRIEAQIIAISDVIDAMISHRPYRPALSKEIVINELKSKSGIHFNRKITEIAIDILNELEV
ncbi:putative nucleotidyltransferase with HDIG domain [Hypnocyclicus thermotrophus]|uniref:Nucleotidyltransferase with HDIG domain n=1 Tax=Hypnocyclicus thermotrophus TaxID=1627895 RepID=A0AA46E1D5_9FUSO|nr:HD-GYP domain-containing protein [Hypnocyclicus thermotrophus]TDT72508.1 putative nucleotidyltransferase with HDIG domain [Hypnocyclicus thermotrophus]